VNITMPGVAPSHLRRGSALLALALSGFLVVPGTAQGTGQVRHYYIQAENVDWTVVPTGYYDDKLGREVPAGDTRFPAIVLRGYEDSDFTRPLPRPSWMGILGPTSSRSTASRSWEASRAWRLAWASACASA